MRTLRNLSFVAYNKKTTCILSFLVIFNANIRRTLHNNHFSYRLTVDRPRTLSDFSFDLLGFLRSNMTTKTDAAMMFQGSESLHGEKLIYPAASRNKEPILQVLKTVITALAGNTDGASPLFLEISSGSGQHVAHFAPHFPGVTFQPTEFDKSLFGSIAYYASSCPTKNILQPKFVDISQKLTTFGFKENSVDYIYSANLIHISPYECTIGLIENAGAYLKPEGLLITYGPYSKDGIITPDSNVQFDSSLRARNPLWGLRDISELIKLGGKVSLTLVNIVEMPANNKILIWKKNK